MVNDDSDTTKTTKMTMMAMTALVHRVIQLISAPPLFMAPDDDDDDDYAGGANTTTDNQTAMYGSSVDVCPFGMLVHMLWSGEEPYADYMQQQQPTCSTSHISSRGCHQ